MKINDSLFHLHFITYKPLELMFPFPWIYFIICQMQQILSKTVYRYSAAWILPRWRNLV